MRLQEFVDDRRVTVAEDRPNDTVSFNLPSIVPAVKTPSIPEPTVFDFTFREPKCITHQYIVQTVHHDKDVARLVAQTTVPYAFKIEGLL